MGAAGKNLEICHSRLPEMHFQTPEWLKISLKNLPTTEDLFDKSHDAVPKLIQPHSQDFFSLYSKIKKKFLSDFSLKIGCDGPNYLNHLIISPKLFCWLSIDFLGLE